MADRKKSAPTEGVLSRVDVGRREALRRMLVGAAFIAPALVSLPLAYGDPAQIHPPGHPTPRPTRRPPRS